MAEPNCARCPLAEHCTKEQPNTVASDVVIVLDQVDNSAKNTGYYCNDASSEVLLKALRKTGRKRNTVSYVPAIRGQYPGMSRAKYRGLWERKHKQKWGQDVPSPEDCCAPWFASEMRKYKNAIALGPRAASALLRGAPGFDKTRGTPVLPDSTKYDQRVLVTWAPWMLRVEPKFTPFFERDIRKAFAFFSGEIAPETPELVEITPENFADTCAQLKTEAETRGIVFWDIESAAYAYETKADGEIRPRYNTLFNPLIILGMGWRDKAFVANFSRDVWSDEQKDRVIACYAGILEDPDVIKVGQNSVAYDEQNLGSLYGIEVNNHRDTMVMARIVDPELPKSLAFLAAAYTNAIGWKDGADYSDSSYNAMDCSITHQVYTALDAKIRRSPQRKVYKKIVQAQKALNRMARVGVPVSESKRAAMQQHYHDAQAKALDAVRSVTGAKFNPRSSADLEKLLYHKWSLVPPDWTKSGAPSTDKHAMIEHLSNPTLTDEQRFCIDNIRRYKLASTLLSSYLRPWSAEGCIVREGRIYPGLNAAGTLGARPSSSSPNMLVTPRVLKSLLCPPEGWALVECDLSGAEYQYVINAAKITPLLEARDSGADGHGTVLEMIYGSDVASRLPGYPEGGPQSGSKGSGVYKDKRQLVKAFVFASLYAAKAPAKHRILRSDTDPQTWNLNNIDLSLAAVQAMDVTFHRTFPQLKAWWASLREQYDAQGFVRDSTWGLIRPMANGYKPTEAANFMAQSSTAGYVIDAMLSVIDHPLVRPTPSGRGLNLTVYDSLWALVPEGDAEATCELLYNAMRVNNNGLVIDAEAEWKDSSGETHVWRP